MRKDILIAPSILSADFSYLAEEIVSVSDAGADIIHLDVMDGNFVNNITIGPVVIKSLRKHTSLPFDVHLMIENALNYIPAFIDSGADIITVHPESNIDLSKAIKLIHKYNKKVGIALNPETSPQILKKFLPYVDLVLIMTVNPGFGGQKFMADQLEKISYVNMLIEKSGRKIELEVDGGINIKNAKQIIDLGASILVAGSSIFNKTKSYKKNIEELRSGPAGTQ